MGTIYDLTQVDLYQEFENWRTESRWPKGDFCAKRTLIHISYFA